MKFKLSILLVTIILLSFVKGEDTKPFTVTYSNNPSPGYLLMDSYQDGLFYLTDNLGYPVLQANLLIEKKILNPKLQSNGLISFFGGDRVYLMNNKYELVDSFISEIGLDVDFHDFLILPNGNAVLLSLEKRIIKLGQSSDGKDVLVTGSIIQEFGKNKELLFLWKSLDHYNIKDVVPPIDTTQSSVIVTNLNSIFYDNDGNFVISNRALDEITKINSKTGNIIWRLGGKECKNNQFQYLNDTIDGFYGFSHQHSISRLTNGNLLLFDNGNIKPNPYSRAVEYKLDEINKTIEKVWEFTEFPDIFSRSMGSVQRLPNGNTLIGWGQNPQNKTATEIKPDGTKALEIVGFQTYTAYKVIFNMDAVIHYVDGTGDYDFNDSVNKTNVRLIINKLNGKGYVSAEKHNYLPHDLVFSEQAPYDLIGNRWVISQTGINDVNSAIRFYINIDSIYDDSEYSLFYREYEGKGIFIPLEKIYNAEDKYFESNIKQFGEFIIGLYPSLLPPLGLTPPDSAVNVDILTSFVWQVSSLVSSYRLQVSRTPDFSDLVVDTSGIINYYMYLYTNYNTKYYWRVKSYYENKQSPWSKPLVFTTKPVTKVEEVDNTGISISNLRYELVIKINDGNSGQFKFTLFNVLGNSVKEVSSKDYDTNIIEINSNDICTGLYFYRLINTNRIYCGKIFIKN